MHSKYIPTNCSNCGKLVFRKLGGLLVHRSFCCQRCVDEYAKDHPDFDLEREKKNNFSKFIKGLLAFSCVVLLILLVIVLASSASDGRGRIESESKKNSEPLKIVSTNPASDAVKLDVPPSACGVSGIAKMSRNEINDGACGVSVIAKISRNEINAGERAELQIKLTGTPYANVPQQIPVEGLQIRLTGKSAGTQKENFNTSSYVVYNYIVVPLRTGNFTIPGVMVDTAGGLQFRTPPLQFSVTETQTLPPLPREYPKISMPTPMPQGFDDPIFRKLH